MKIRYSSWGVKGFIFDTLGYILTIFDDIHPHPSGPVPVVSTGNVLRSWTPLRRPTSDPSLYRHSPKSRREPRSGGKRPGGVREKTLQPNPEWRLETFRSVDSRSRPFRLTNIGSTQGIRDSLGQGYCLHHCHKRSTPTKFRRYSVRCTSRPCNDRCLNDRSHLQSRKLLKSSLNS